MLMNGLRLCGSSGPCAKRHIRVEYPAMTANSKLGLLPAPLYLNNRLFCYDAVP